MSSKETEQKAKIKLAELSAKFDTVINEILEDLTPQEIDFILENYSKYLTYDIKRNFDIIVNGAKMNPRQNS